MTDPTPLPPGFRPPAPDAPRFDPHAVPVLPAATVLLVDDRRDHGGDALEVLLLRRRAGSAFVGGMTLFPGGGLDPHDADAGYEARLGLDDATASARLGLDAGGLAYWVAVVRETFEEAGVLLARTRDGAPPPPDAFAARDAVDRGERTLLEVLVAHDLVVETPAIAPIARWVTPVGPPRRYDTQFFAAAMPADQEATVDEVEAVHGEWRTPAAALAGFASGELTMLPPTVAMLRVLGGFSSVGAFLAHASTLRPPGGQARVVSTRGEAKGGMGAPLDRDGPTFRVVLPGDPDQVADGGDGVLGWVYLPESAGEEEPA